MIKNVINLDLHYDYYRHFWVELFYRSTLTFKTICTKSHGHAPFTLAGGVVIGLLKSNICGSETNKNIMLIILRYNIIQSY